MSRAVLVDTDVVSYLYKGDTRASAYARHLAGTRPHVAFATVAELYRWAVQRGWAQVRTDKLRATIAKYTVLHSDESTTMEWPGSCRSKGDQWLTATHGRGSTTSRHAAGHAQPQAFRRYSGTGRRPRSLT